MAFRSHLMLRATLLLLLAFAVIPVLPGQSNSFDYGNGWYISDPAREFIRIKVWEDGIYRVSWANLLASGHNLSGVNADHLQLFYRGVEQPVFMMKNAQNELIYFDFQGLRNDGEIDASMYRNPVTGIHDPDQQPHPEISLFSDTAVYILTWDSQPGLRYSTFLDTNYSTYTPELSYPFAAEREYHPTDPETTYLLGGGGAYDSFFTLNSDYVTGEGYAGPGFSYQQPVTVTIQTPAAANTGSPMDIRLRIFGRSNSGHHIKVSVNGGAVPLLDTLYANSQVFIKTFERSVSASLSPQTDLNFEALFPATDHNHLIHASIRYNRLCDLQGGGTTIIDHWQNSLNPFFSFSNSNGIDSVWVYDLLHQRRSAGTISPAGEARIILPGQSQPSSLRLVADTDIQTPLIESTHHLSNLCHPDSGAAYVIITHRSLAASAYEYATYRDTNSINSFPVRVVFTDQIYDEFGYGSETPWAIKRFLNCAYTTWNTPPQYVLLWGKGGFKPRDQTYSLVPTYGYPATDYEFVTGFDSAASILMPFVPVGRVSVQTNQEGQDYLEKVREFEYSGCELWRRRGVFLGGGATAGEWNAIAGAMDNLVQTYSGNPWFGIPYYYQKDSSAIPLDSLQAYWDTISSGVGIIQFFGHSTTNILDVPLNEPWDHGNFGRYPFMVGMGCYGGDFTLSGHSFGERWLLEPSRGAIGYLSNSSAAYLNPLRDYGGMLYQELFINQLNQSVGDAILSTFHAYNDSLTGIQYRNHSRQMNLQGDPAINITPCSALNSGSPVWPGDANTDGVADINDLLRIGLGYGTSGTTRTDTSINWYAHPAQPWDSVFIDSVNFKHADSNGDGLIDVTDTLGIAINYSLTHNKGDNFTIGGTPLTLVYPSSVQEEDTVHVEVFLGDSTSQETLYGIVFTLTYDPDMIQENSVSLQTGNSWLGTEGVDMITMTKDHYAEGRVDIGLTRIDHINRTGYGKIADITIVITDDIAKKEWGPMELGLGYGFAGNASGQEIPLSDVLVADQVEIPEFYDFIRIYPNPAKKVLHIEPNGMRLQNLELLNLMGQSVWRANGEVLSDLDIETGGYSRGVYVIRYRQNGEWILRKVVLE